MSTRRRPSRRAVTCSTTSDASTCTEWASPTVACWPSHRMRSPSAPSDRAPRSSRRSSFSVASFFMSCPTACTRSATSACMRQPLPGAVNRRAHALERRSALRSLAAGATGSSSSPDASYPAARAAAGPWSPSSSPPVVIHPHAPHDVLVARSHFDPAPVRCPPRALAAPCPRDMRTPSFSHGGSVLTRPATSSWLARLDRSPSALWYRSRRVPARGTAASDRH